MDIDRIIAEIALRHHGAVPREDTRIERLDPEALHRRIVAAAIDELSPRVLKPAAAPWTPELRISAATLDVPGGAVASFETAAWLWRFPGFGLGPTIHVTACRGQRWTSSLAAVHRPVVLHDHHVTMWRGLPVTTVARTIFDLASRLHPKRLERLIDTICTQSPAALVQMHRLLPELAARGRRGIPMVRDILSRRPIGIRVAPSGYQARFEEVMANAGITGLRREVDVGGHSWVGRVDYLDEVTGGPVEVDSILYHSSPTDVANDEARDAELEAAGFPPVVRIIAEELYPRPWIAVSQVRTHRTRYRRPADVPVRGTEKEGSGAAAS